jgi:iron complex transport system ATP-binding protein
MYALQVNNLEFGYKDDLVIKDISFNVKKGKFISIIGPNGSGKSTLLKTLNNLYRPSKGQILLEGRDINSFKKREIAQKIALVPQDTNIDYDFTVEDIVMMGRHPYKNRFEKENDNDYKIINQALEMTNTLGLKKRLITEISGGERQRVIIAKALAQEPSMIFLDEPTSNLDINHQMDILNLLKTFNEEQETTVVLVIHDINLAARYSDEIILLDKGRILGKGSPEEVITVKNIEQAYNMKVAIEKNKYTGTTYLTPIEIRKRKRNYKFNNVHIVSGGGSGQEVINRLYKEGFNLSLGVLNVGDTDWDHGKSLYIPIVEEAPFAGISDKSYIKNIDAILKSDIVVITNVPIGTGNIKNLLAAQRGLEAGKKVYYLGNNNMNFDYTTGEATKIIEDMKLKGMQYIKTIDELIKEIV